MFDQYHSYGCIDFHNGSYAITIPIFKRSSSNYVYVPKTDRLFNILDFYEMEEMPYHIMYFDKNQSFSARIGDKLMVPVTTSTGVVILNPTWSEAEIVQRYPALDKKALSAFISLRRRLRDDVQLSSEQSFSEDVAKFLSEPVRSRYWIAKLSALVNSSREQLVLEKHRKSLAKARDEWIKRFAYKSSLKLLESLISIEGISLAKEDKSSVYLERAKHGLMRRGLYISKEEKQFLQRKFPSGLLAYKRSVSKKASEYDEYSKEIVERIEDEIFAQFQIGNGAKGRDFHAWSMEELERILSIVRMLEGGDNIFDAALNRFSPVYQDGHAGLISITENRHRMAWAIIEHNVDEYHIQKTLEILNSHLVLSRYEHDKWFKMCSDVLDYHDKLILVRRLLQPLERDTPEEYMTIEGVDYTLLHAMRDAAAEHRLDAFYDMLRIRNLHLG